MMRFLLIFIFLLPFQFLPSNEGNTASHPWTLSKNQDGIRIYTRTVAGSDLLEFKGITVVNATLKNLILKIQRVDNYSKWMQNIEESRLLKKVDKTHFYSYTEEDVPWPFSNRDIVLLNSVAANDSIAVISLESKPDYIPEKNGIVRIKIGKGYWKFVKISKKKSRVEYCFYSDPEGSFPDWIVNKFIVDVPFSTLKNLKEMYQ